MSCDSSEADMILLAVRSLCLLERRLDFDGEDTQFLFYLWFSIGLRFVSLYS